MKTKHVKTSPAQAKKYPQILTIGDFKLEGVHKCKYLRSIVKSK